MPFAGWPEEALEFYEGLEADNSRIYWTKHKPVYEESVLAPMAELLAELAPRFGETKIFRPYRDVRFSKDKTPYKTHIGARVGSGYIQLSARSLAVGDGMYTMAPAQLAAYRRAVDAAETGQELQRLIAAVETEDIGVHGRDVLKSAPRGYPADHPRIGLLRYKGLVAWTEWPAGPWLGTADARDRVAGVLAATGPLSGWLRRHAGLPGAVT
jgi:uncharacterized protein (TIGR02453 family)